MKYIIYKVVMGKENSLHGWRITKEEVLHPNVDIKLYTFLHNDGTIEKDITQKDFRKKYNLSHPNLCKLLNGECKTIKKWRVHHV